MAGQSGVVIAVTFIVAFAGCVADPGIDAAPDTPGAAIDVLTFTDVVGPGASVPLRGHAPHSGNVSHAVAVPPTTTWFVVDTDGDVGLHVHDPAGGHWCGVRAKTCAVPVSDPAAGAWAVTVISLAPAEQTVQTTVAFYASPIVLGDDAVPFAAFTVFQADHIGGEPTLAPLPDGRAVVAADFAVMRLETDGSFTDVTPLVDALLADTLDPFVVGDPVTGRVYVSQLGACQRLSFTDDAGDSWITNPVACGGPDQHHQKLAVGPDHLGTGARVLHMLTMNLGSWFATDDVVITAARSTDSGVTWTQNPAMVRDVHGMEARAIGNIDVADDGSVHAVAYLCEAFNGAPYDGMGVGRSDDGGVTWLWERVSPGGGDCQGIDPGIALAGDAMHVVGWDAAAGAPTLWHIEGSLAERVWREPRAIPTAGLRSFVLADVDANERGAVAAFLATPDTDVGPNGAPGWTRWFPYVATFDAAADTWTVERLADHPVQRGRICMEGPQCLDGSRNLLDFIDVQIGLDGRAFIAFPDGCPADCVTAPDSREALLQVAIGPGP